MRLRIKEAMGLRQAMGRPIKTAELGKKIFPKASSHSQYQSMRRMIAGESIQVKFETLIKLSQELGVTTDYLLGLED